MENIIDERYFWGELKIAGIEASRATTTQSVGANKKNTELNLFIAKYQKKYLTEMFGEDLAKELPAELKELLYDESTLASPIANYVYYFYQKANATQTTNAGEKKLTVQNTLVVSPKRKSNDAWNEMVTKNISIHLTLAATETLEYAVPLSYIKDIRPNINIEDNIFKYTNMYDF